MIATEMIHEDIVRFEDGEVVDFGFERDPLPLKGTQDGAIFDALYASRKDILGTRYAHPIYIRWDSMRKRVLNKKDRACYRGTSICEEWMTYSNFAKWLMQQHDWLNRSLDKDILVPGNKIYSPETCCVVPGNVNSLLNNGGNTERRDVPLGVDTYVLKYKNPDIIGIHYRWLEQKIDQIVLAIQDLCPHHDGHIIKALMGRIDYIADAIDNNEMIYTLN